MHDLISAIAARLERAADRMANANAVVQERQLRTAAAAIRRNGDLGEALELEKRLVHAPIAATAARLVAFAAAEYVPAASDVPTPEPNPAPADPAAAQAAAAAAPDAPAPTPNAATPDPAPNPDAPFGGEAVTPARRQSVADSVTFDPGIPASDITDPKIASPEIVRTIDQITSSEPGGLDTSINISAIKTGHRPDTVHAQGVAFDVNKIDDVHVGADQATKDFVKNVINNVSDVTAIGSVKEVIEDKDVQKAAAAKGVTLRLDEPLKPDGTRVFHVHIESN